MTSDKGEEEEKKGERERGLWSSNASKVEAVSRGGSRGRRWRKRRQAHEADG